MFINHGSTLPSEADFLKEMHKAQCQGLGDHSDQLTFRSIFLTYVSGMGSLYNTLHEGPP